MKKLEKLFAYKNVATALNNCKTENDEIAVKKHFERIANKSIEVPVNVWLNSIIIDKLFKIASNMPSEGYAMGGQINVRFCKLVGRYSNCQEYAKSSKYKAKHGFYEISLSKDEYLNMSVLGGLVTYIYPNQKSRVQKCWWYESKGKKNTFELVKKHGYVYNGYHAIEKKNAIEWKRVQAIIGASKKEAFESAKRREKYEKMKKRALNSSYGFKDSIMAGNCEVGTKAFILRCKLDANKKYKGFKLLQIAEKNSQTSLGYITRMIGYKASQLCQK
jgi:hypothetical protein